VGSSSLIRDWTQAPCIMSCGILATGPRGKSPFLNIATKNAHNPLIQIPLICQDPAGGKPKDVGKEVSNPREHWCKKVHTPLFLYLLFFFPMEALILFQSAQAWDYDCLRSRHRENKRNMYLLNSWTNSILCPVFKPAMAPHSSALAWRIPWTEEPGGLQSNGVTRSRTRLSDFTFTFHFHALEKEMATHSSVLAWKIPGTGEPGGLPCMRSQSRTRLKRLSSSSNTPDWEETSRPCVWIIVSWQSEVLEYPKDWSLLTPLIVSRSRIQVCGVMEDNCPKISTQMFSDQWSSHTYSQQHKYHRLAL